MKLKQTSITLVTGVAVIVFGSTLVHAVFYAPDSSTVETPQMAASVHINAPENPARLRIPRLHIQAAVQYVGINGSGNMATPSNFTDVAWYKYGTVPGQMGSAVINGHVDNGLALAGVFKHLQDIQTGDDIYIDTKQGSSLHFVVERVVLYPYKDVPTDLVFNQKDAPRLNLITCDGNWVKAGKTYDKRLVVYAVLKNT